MQNYKQEVCKNLTNVKNCEGIDIIHLLVSKGYSLFFIVQ